MPTQVQQTNRATGRPIKPQANAAGDALVAAGDSEFVEVNRRGNGFIVRSTTATAPVIALPTTTAGLGIFNQAPDGGKSIVIDSLFAIQITSAANLTQNGIIYVLGQTRVAPFTSLLDTVRKGNGLGPETSTVALVKAGGAILDSVTGVAIGWMPIETSVNSAVNSLIGVNLTAKVDGRLFIPPGRQFGINIMSSHNTGTWNVGMTWHEELLDLAN